MEVFRRVAFRDEGGVRDSRDDILGLVWMEMLFRKN